MMKGAIRTGIMWRLEVSVEVVPQWSTVVCLFEKRWMVNEDLVTFVTRILIHLMVSFSASLLLRVSIINHAPGPRCAPAIRISVERLCQRTSSTVLLHACYPSPVRLSLPLRSPSLSSFSTALLRLSCFFSLKQDRMASGIACVYTMGAMLATWVEHLYGSG